jgi:hypothetical protein
MVLLTKRERENTLAKLFAQKNVKRETQWSLLKEPKKKRIFFPKFLLKKPQKRRSKKASWKDATTYLHELKTISSFCKSQGNANIMHKQVLLATKLVWTLIYDANTSLDPHWTYVSNILGKLGKLGMKQVIPMPNSFNFRNYFNV